jgi:hypothetical protein
MIIRRNNEANKLIETQYCKVFIQLYILVYNNNNNNDNIYDIKTLAFPRNRIKDLESLKLKYCQHQHNEVIFDTCQTA